MVRTEIIVEVGAEGGSLTIEGKHYGDTGWSFRMVQNEVALYDDCVDDDKPADLTGFFRQTDYLDTLGEALKLFDKYPYWIDLYVVQVHPDFVDEVLAEVRSRGGTSAEKHWREALERKRSESQFNHSEEIPVLDSQVGSLRNKVSMTIARKYERDIDLLLAEEFAVSPSFATWFLKQTRDFNGVQARVVDVGVSRSDTTGESDLVVVFEDQNGHNFALHIEDKIDAPLQPEQESRYRLRAQTTINQGVYSAFEVVLCCPKAYPLTHAESSRFDSCVHYEAISAFLKLQGENASRSAYRAEFVATAAKRSSPYGGRTDDPVTNMFWRAAYDIAVRDFPDLEMQEPEFTKGQTWVSFRPLDMPTQPRRIYVYCKGGCGYVDLTFSTCLARLFAPRLSAVLEKDMYVQQTGKATAIRIEVPSFEICEPNDAVLTKVRAAFGACVRLIQFYRQNRMLLNEAAAAALPQP
jgi:hypothetical protein